MKFYPTNEYKPSPIGHSPNAVVCFTSISCRFGQSGDIPEPVSLQKGGLEASLGVWKQPSGKACAGRQGPGARPLLIHHLLAIFTSRSSRRRLWLQGLLHTPLGHCH